MLTYREWGRAIPAWKIQKNQLWSRKAEGLRATEKLNDFHEKLKRPRLAVSAQLRSGLRAHSAQSRFTALFHDKGN